VIGGWKYHTKKCGCIEAWYALKLPELRVWFALSASPRCLRSPGYFCDLLSAKAAGEGRCGNCGRLVTTATAMTPMLRWRAWHGRLHATYQEEVIRCLPRGGFLSGNLPTRLSVHERGKPGLGVAMRRVLSSSGTLSDRRGVTGARSHASASRAENACSAARAHRFPLTAFDLAHSRKDIARVKMLEIQVFLQASPAANFSARSVQCLCTLDSGVPGQHSFSGLGRQYL
jgi:hypothetical protein